VGLWYYRAGNYEKALARCRRYLNEDDANSAPNATTRIIMAMSLHQLGQADDARLQLAKARNPIDQKFKNGLERGNAGLGMWYDWVFARILLREAEALIGGGSRVDAAPKQP
jgi:Flp pilus assembly protein TadD